MQTRRTNRRHSRTQTRKNRHALYHAAAFNPKKSVHIPTHALLNKSHNKHYRKTPFNRGGSYRDATDDL
jgi:hypothetical protein